MKHYTKAKAIKEIGKSINFNDALKVSIKKWEEIDKYGNKHYKNGDSCGFCIVSFSKKLGNIESKYSCDCSISYSICPFSIYGCFLNLAKPKTMLRRFKTKKMQKAIDECNAIVQKALKDK